MFLYPRAKIGWLSTYRALRVFMQQRLRGGLLRRFHKGHPSIVLLSRNPGALHNGFRAYLGFLPDSHSLKRRRDAPSFGKAISVRSHVGPRPLVTDRPCDT